MAPEDVHDGQGTRLRRSADTVKFREVLPTG
jgi:hypothetical protein